MVENVTLRDTFSEVPLLKQIKVVYDTGAVEYFEAGYLKEDGLVFGRIYPLEPAEQKQLGISEEFVVCGFIFKSSIEEISFDSKTKKYQRR